MANRQQKRHPFVKKESYAERVQRLIRAYKKN